MGSLVAREWAQITQAAGAVGVVPTELMPSPAAEPVEQVAQPQSQEQHPRVLMLPVRTSSVAAEVVVAKTLATVQGEPVARAGLVVAVRELMGPP